MKEADVKDIALAKFVVNQLYGNSATKMLNEENKENTDEKVVTNCKQQMELLAKYRENIQQEETQQTILKSCGKQGRI